MLALFFAVGLTCFIHTMCNLFCFVLTSDWEISKDDAEGLDSIVRNFGASYAVAYKFATLLDAKQVKADGKKQVWR